MEYTLFEYIFFAGRINEKYPEYLDNLKRELFKNRDDENIENKTLNDVKATFVKGFRKNIVLREVLTKKLNGVEACLDYAFSPNGDEDKQKKIAYRIELRELIPHAYLLEEGTVDPRAKSYAKQLDEELSSLKAAGYKVKDLLDC